MFDDDWDAAGYLYPRSSNSTTAPFQGKRKAKSEQQQFRPPVTLLVITVGENIIFDPTREEVSVAEAVLAVSVGRSGSGSHNDNNMLQLISIRTIDPPSRFTQPGIPDSENAATISAAGRDGDEASAGQTSISEKEEMQGVWRPRRGGVKRGVILRMVKMVLEKGCVGDEVMEGLEGVEVG
jgi:exosome complex component RRP42